MKIKALVVEQKDGPFVLQEIDLAPPGRGEALVRITACGVCHAPPTCDCRTTRAVREISHGQTIRTARTVPITRIILVF